LANVKGSQTRALLGLMLAYRAVGSHHKDALARVPTARAWAEGTRFADHPYVYAVLQAHALDDAGRTREAEQTLAALKDSCAGVAWTVDPVIARWAAERGAAAAVEEALADYVAGARLRAWDKSSGW